MKKRKLWLLAALPLATLAFLGAGSASARGMFGGGFGMGLGMMGMGFNLTPDEIASRQSAMFQHQAQIFGVSEEDLKAGWAEGQSPWDVALEKGQTQEQIQTRMRQAQVSQMKTQLQTLVDKGVITQAQADKRLQLLGTQIQKFGNRMMGGMGGHHGWGW